MAVVRIGKNGAFTSVATEQREQDAEDRRAWDAAAESNQRERDEERRRGRRG